MTRPVIGITAYLVLARWSHFNFEVSLVPTDYIRAIESSGGRAVLLPPSAYGIDETLGAIDGLLLTGGEDIDPSLYGQEPHQETFGIRPDRDEAEFELARAALTSNMPVLGICRGCQVLNVMRGGSLVQHLPDLVGNESHKQTPGVFVEHDVRSVEGTQLAQLLGDSKRVKSHHHQGIDQVGHGLVAAAYADDGTLEGIEDPSQRFTLGVLWHAEADADKRIFRRLVAEARHYRKERR